MGNAANTNKGNKYTVAIKGKGYLFETSLRAATISAKAWISEGANGEIVKVYRNGFPFLAWKLVNGAAKAVTA